MTLLVFIKQLELSCFSSYQINMEEWKRFYPRPEDRELPDSTGKKKKYIKSRVVNLWMEENEAEMHIESEQKSKKKNLNSKK